MLALPASIAPALAAPSAAQEADIPDTPRADQELAGVLMWVGGMLGYLIAGTVVFFRWAGPEAREDGEARLAPAEATRGA